MKVKLAYTPASSKFMLCAKLDFLHDLTTEKKSGTTLQNVHNLYHATYKNFAFLLFYVYV
jgi:hypothetical protein